MIIAPHSTQRAATTDGRARHRLRTALGLTAALVVLAATALDVLGFVIAVPLIGGCLFLATPPDAVTRRVPVGRRTVLVALAALASFAVVALLPYETVFLLQFGEYVAMLVMTLAATAAIALPLAVHEAPVPDSGPSHVLVGRRSLVAASALLTTVAARHNAASTFMLVLAVALGLPFLAGVWCLVRRASLDTRLWRHPLSRQARPSLLQLLNRWVLLGLAAATVSTGAYEALRWDLGEQTYGVVVVGFVVGLVASGLLASLTPPPVRLAPNLAVAAILVFLAGQLAWSLAGPADAVTLASPVTGRWWVANGGHAELVNGHNVAVAQGHALDLIQVNEGSNHVGDPFDLRSYHAWRQPLLAAADGVVATATDTQPDQPIGSVDRRRPAGNHIVIDIGGGRYIAYGHLQHGSLRVGVGDRVRRGDVIGLVGNSGNSDEPHLHFQVQNHAVFDVITPPAGLRTYPFRFDGVTVTRGASTSPSFDLRRGDFFATL